MRQHGLTDCFVWICDPSVMWWQPPAAQMLAGGSAYPWEEKSGDLHRSLLEARYEVASLHHGRFDELEARHGGTIQFGMGATTVLCTNAGLIVMGTLRRVFPVSICQLNSCGINPSALTSSQPRA